MKNLLYISAAILMFTGCKPEPDKKQEVAETSEIPKTWWKEGILYQLYPQSFNDNDGDGFGDFKGIIEKLDYLESLSITMVWMNPFFDSPLVDNGYDVSDYRAILPRYGTLEDFDAMLAGMHKRGIKFVLDIVVGFVNGKLNFGYKEAWISIERFMASRHGWSLRHCENPIRTISPGAFYGMRKIKEKDKTSDKIMLFLEIIRYLIAYRKFNEN